MKRHVNGVHRGIVSTSINTKTTEFASSAKDERKAEIRPKTKRKSNYATSPDISMESDGAQTDQGNLHTNDAYDEISCFEPITFQETLTSVESSVQFVNDDPMDIFKSSLGIEEVLAKKGPHSIEMLTTPTMGLDEEVYSDDD